MLTMGKRAQQIGHLAHGIAARLEKYARIVSKQFPASYPADEMGRTVFALMEAAQHFYNTNAYFKTYADLLNDGNRAQGGLKWILREVKEGLGNMPYVIRAYHSAMNYLPNDSYRNPFIREIKKLQNVMDKYQDEVYYVYRALGKR